MTEIELSEWIALIESAARRLAKKIASVSYADALQHALIAAWKIRLDKRYSKKRQENYLRKYLYLRALSELKKEFSFNVDISFENFPSKDETREIEAFSDFETILDQSLRRFRVVKRDRARRISVMFFVERYSTSEISKELKVSQRTVQRTIRTVRQIFIDAKD